MATSHSKPHRETRATTLSALIAERDTIAAWIDAQDLEYAPEPVKEAIYAACSDLERRIVSEPARSVADLLLKLAEIQLVDYGQRCPGSPLNSISLGLDSLAADAKRLLAGQSESAICPGDPLLNRAIAAVQAALD